MPGLTDYTATAMLNETSGAGGYAMFSPNVNRYLALFTAAPLNDAGTGGTEVAGSAYARQQVGGSLTAAGTWTTASTTITLSANVPPWVTTLGATPGFGVNVWDSTVTPAPGALIGAVSSCSGAVVTLQAAAQHASQGASDVLYFSAFGMATPSVNAEPGTTPASSVNVAQINFPQSTGSWGTVLAWAIFSPTATMYFWDYLGNFPWLPATNSVASPGVINAARHGLVAGTPFAVSAKAGGNFPNFSASNFTNNVGTLLVVGPTTDTFTATNAGTAVNTSTTGDFMIRGLTAQAIPTNTTPQFAAGAFTIFAA